MRRRRAFLLIMVLFLVAILAVMGFGFLGSRVSQYQSTGQAVQAAQARALARAGIEDARAKLNVDIRFPPAQGANQLLFTYTETVMDSNNTNPVGSYRVTLNTTYAQQSPYFLLGITSVGQVASTTTGVPATHTYRAYIDVSPIVTPASPTYFQIVRFEDLGGI